MVIKDKPHGYDSKEIGKKCQRADALLSKRYPKMHPAERSSYMLGLGAGRVLALLAFEKKEKAEKKAKTSKKAAKK